MARKITFREVSDDMKRLVAPLNKVTSTRASIGMERSIGEFHYLSVNILIPYHKQARKVFDQESLENLSDSIKLYGIRQPLTVIKSEIEEDKFEVVSGERRLKAAIIAGLDKVPCIILEAIDNTDAIALVENIHRKDLHPIELGDAFKKYMSQFNVTQEQLSKTLSVSKSIVSETIKFANFEPEVIDILLQNNIVDKPVLRSLYKLSTTKERIDKIKQMVDSKNKGENRKKSLVNITLENGVIISHILKNNIKDVSKQNVIAELERIIMNLKR